MKDREWSQELARFEGRINRTATPKGPQVGRGRVHPRDEYGRRVTGKVVVSTYLDATDVALLDSQCAGENRSAFVRRVVLAALRGTP